MLNKQHIPNLLTWARLAAVPLVLVAWYLPPPWGQWLPLVVVVLASITDFFDGYLARKWNAQSDLGRLLDPNADKLLMAVSMLLLVSTSHASAVAVSLILCRELFVSGLRESMAEKDIIIHVTRLAKYKTAMQMAAVIVLLYAYASGGDFSAHLGSLLLWIAAILTLITGWQYWCGAWPYLKR